MWRTEVGGRASQCYTIGGGILTPNIKLSWIYEAREQGAKTKAEFACTPACCPCFPDAGIFRVDGLNPSRSLAAPSAELTYLLANSRYTFSLLYEGEFGHNWRDQLGSLTMAYRY